MNIYTLHRKDHVGIDEMRACVVRAASVYEARELAATQAVDEGEDLWFTGFVDITQVGTSETAQAVVLLADVNSGG